MQKLGKRITKFQTEVDLSVKESTVLGELYRAASRKGIEVPKGLGFCASRNLHTVSIGIMLPYQVYVNFDSKFNNESEKRYCSYCQI